MPAPKSKPVNYSLRLTMILFGLGLLLDPPLAIAATVAGGLALGSKELGINGFGNTPDLASGLVGFEPAFPDKPELPLLARDFRLIKDKICKRKTAEQGGGKSKGRKCFINNVWYFLKYDSNGDRLGEYYNVFFAKNVLDISTPKVEFVINDPEPKKNLGNLLLGSEAISGFISGYDMQKSCTNQIEFRNKVIKNIGDIGIAQLTVAQSFISDLYVGNWGTRDNGGLVLMDVDGGDTQPTTLSGYLKLGTAVHFKQEEQKQNLDQLMLSVANLIKIKEIYESLHDKNLPVIHESVDMSVEFFQTLVNLYITACNNALNKIHETMPDLGANQPDPAVNNYLADAVNMLIKALKAEGHDQYLRSATQINIEIAGIHQPSLLKEETSKATTVKKSVNEINIDKVDVVKPVSYVQESSKLQPTTNLNIDLNNDQMNTHLAISALGILSAAGMLCMAVVRKPFFCRRSQRKATEQLKEVEPLASIAVKMA